MAGGDNPDKAAAPHHNQDAQIADLKHRLARLERERTEERAFLSEVIQATGSIVWLNSGQAVQFLSTVPEDSQFPFELVRSHGFDAAVRSPGQIDYAGELRRCLSEDLPFELDIPLLTADGSKTLWWRFSARPASDSVLRVSGWLGACRNIDVQKKNELALAEALRSRSEFVAHVSHELRTPLNGILPMIEVLLRSQLSDETRGHVLTLKEAGATLLNVINSVLDYSKLEAGKALAETVEVDIISLVERVAQIFSTLAANKGLLLLTSIASDVPERIMGDPQRISQALSNLLGNAVKFTDKGVVSLSVTVEPAGLNHDLLCFAVADTGPGISSEFRQKLFEPFFQGSGENYREQAGSGLGLSITKRLVELMGGCIKAESEPGAGSTFRFSIPLHSPMRTIPITAVNSSFVRDVANPVNSFGAVSRNDRPNLLSFEPLHGGRWALAEAFANYDVRVESSDNIAAALGILKRNMYGDARQVLVLDMVRFKKRSEELLARLQNLEFFDRVKIIAVVDDEQIGAGGNGQIIYLAMPLRRQDVLWALSLGRAPRFTAVRSRNQLDASPGPIAVMDAEKNSAGRRQIAALTKHRRALVADDNRINRQVAAIFLSDLGLEVSLAADGVEAVHAFKERDYDLVFLDCQMPLVDGFEVATLIKEIGRRKGLSVPIVALTADVLEGAREQCLANGMDDYVSKPISPEALEQVVEKWLGRPSRSQHLLRTSQTVPTVVINSGNCGIDMNRLLQKFGEPHSRAVLQTFVDTCEVELRLVESAQAAGDVLETRRLLESCRDSFLLIEAPELAAICLDAARSLSTGDSASAATALKRLHRAVSRLKGELSQVLADRSTKVLPVVQP